MRCQYNNGKTVQNSTLNHPWKCHLSMVITLESTPTNINVICAWFLKGFSKLVSKVNTKVGYKI